MPSLTTKDLRFDSIEDTIEAFSELLFLLLREKKNKPIAVLLAYLRRSATILCFLQFSTVYIIVLLS